MYLVYFIIIFFIWIMCVVLNMEKEVMNLRGSRDIVLFRRMRWALGEIM